MPCCFSWPTLWLASFKVSGGISLLLCTCTSGLVLPGREKLWEIPSTFIYYFRWGEYTPVGPLWCGKPLGLFPPYGYLWSQRLVYLHISNVSVLHLSKNFSRVYLHMGTYWTVRSVSVHVQSYSTVVVLDSLSINTSGIAFDSYSPKLTTARRPVFRSLRSMQQYLVLIYILMTSQEVENLFTCFWAICKDDGSYPLLQNLRDYCFGCMCCTFSFLSSILLFFILLVYRSLNFH